jgi:hypothetical protein
MNELERINNDIPSLPSAKISTSLTPVEVYDKFGSLAYGVILQIVPQPHIAQEILVNVFSSPLLQTCNSYPFTFAVCVIKLARAKAVEAKRKLTEVSGFILETEAEPDKSPEAIFDLSFRQGFTPDEVAEKLQLSKTEVLKAFHDFFKSSRNS